jgi:hypothetical protein
MTKRIITAAVAVLAAIAVLTGCSFSSGDSQRKADEALSSDTYSRQIAAQPYPGAQLTDSLERKNLKERLLRENKPNQIRYLYLLGDTGTYVGYYTIKGKVSSNQSQMLPQDDTVRRCSGCDFLVLDGAGDDGSYGEDAEGQFFFTTENIMVSTDMRYIVSDGPLNVNAPKLNVTK